MHFHNFYIKMYMRVFCMASVLHHTSFLTTRVTFKLRGLHYGDFDGDDEMTGFLDRFEELLKGEVS